MFTDRELDQLDARFKSAMDDKFDAYNEELNARQKEIERLRNALGMIANWGDPDFPCDDMKGEADRNYFIYSTMREIAREALSDD